MNHCHFIGKFTHNPKLEKGGEVNKTVFELALTRKFKKANGELGRQTNYILCEAWASGAEVIVRNFKEGDTIVIHGEARSLDDDSIIFRVKEFDFCSQHDSIEVVSV